MATVYEVFNTKSDYEFSKFLDKLNLNTNELLNMTYIAENSLYNIYDKRKKILEIMAGSADGNYEICLEQFNKNKKERLLKENSFQQLNLNQIMELNDLVVNVAKKLKAPNCMQGIFNIIKSKSNANVANTFLGMVQQSQVNDSNLKFNTELQVNGQNLAQLIYQMKNDIEMFINSVECPKEEKQSEKNEVTENVNNISNENRIAGIYNIKNGSFKILNNGQNHNLSKEDYRKGLIRYGIQEFPSQGIICYITAWNEEYAWNTRRQIMKKYSNIKIDKWHLEYYTVDNIYDGKKYVADYDSNGNQINESSVRKSIPIEQTISSIKNWVQQVNKPSSLKTLIQMIDEYMAIAQNNIQANTLAHLKSIAQTKLNKLNNESPKIEECIAQQVVSDTCGEDTFNGLLNSLKPTMISITVNKETGDIEDNCCSKQDSCEIPTSTVSKYPEPVQSLTISPTAIDAPILEKPNSAEATSAMTALASHINCVKSDSRENNIEELETINTLLNQLSEYFNSILAESIDYSPQKEIFNNYCHKINSLEELVDIADMIMPDLNSGYRYRLHKKLCTYLESIFPNAEHNNSWNEEPDIIISNIIDDNVDSDSAKRAAFIYNELQVMYAIEPQKTFDIVKNYVDSSYSDEEEPEDYWDGEDELNETFGDGMTDPNEEQEEYNDNETLSNEDITYLKRKLPQLYDLKEAYSQYSNDQSKLVKFASEVLDNCLANEYNYILPKPYIDVAHLKLPSGKIFDLESYLNEFNETLEGIEPDDYWDGEDELDENANNYSKYEDFIGKPLKDNDGDLYTIIDFVDDTFGTQYFKIKEKNSDKIILVTIPEMKKYFDININDYVTPNDYWDGEDEELNEDTVFDHSWYENDDGKYPKRTKEGVIGLPIKEGIKDWFKKDDKKYIIKLGNSGYFCKDGHTIIGDINDAMVITGYKKALKIAQKLNKYEGTSLYTPIEINENINETCSAGATCAASVSGFAKPLGSKPKKRKKLSVDVEMFKESVNNNIPCAITIGSNNVKYNIFDNKGYLFINEGIVKAITKQQILEAIDDIYNECLDLPIFEGINPYQFDMLIEDDLNTNTVITPQEKQEQEQELDNEIKANPNLKVGLTDDKSSQMIDNQELVGVDDSNLQDKKYIVKDPITGKIKVANSSQIKIMKNDNGVN